MSYFKPGTSDKLTPMLHELAAKHHVKIPDLGGPPQQRATYEAYVRELGKEPDEVDPMIDLLRMPPEKRAEAHARLLLALMNAETLDPGELQGIITTAIVMIGEHRASLLVQKLTEELVKYCRKQGMRLPELASGVFPMSWFNAQCAMYQDAPIVLLSNGCMSLLEIAVILFFASRKDMSYARRSLRAAVMSYVNSGGSVTPPDYDLGHGVVDFSSSLMHSLTNAAEQFVIAHELGHIVLGHLESKTMHAAPLALHKRTAWQRLTRLARPDLRVETIAVAEKNHFQEHQADLWGYRVMLRLAKAEQESESTVPIATASAGIFLGINMLVEAASRERGIPITDTHPDGAKRLYMVQLLTELEGCHEQGFVARRFYEFLEEVGKDFPTFEMPPYLSRELNHAAIPVMNSLQIDLSNARFIREFN